MQYWGKVVGVVIALFMGGGFWGAVLGLIIGHMFDKARSRKMAWFANQRERQSLFFATTFEVMGHLTKSKGRVTEADIQVASLFMDRMNLHGESRMAAQRAFRDGKADNYPLRDKMRQFRSVCFGRFDLIRMFLEIQIQAAFADGSLHPSEREVLYVIAEELGISRLQFDQFLRMMQGGAQFGGGYHYQQQAGGNGGGWQQAQRGPTLEDACNVLGVKPTDDATTIKRAYRKLMGEHHPDKLVAKGLPPEMMEMAKQKAQEIQKAYELIREQKGFR
ncbi:MULTISPECIES: co-chaperone DjlA [Kosakonia]|uniref:Co-chaperone protein DjlA n=1 Tax=Kosakonia oryzae TaxID=497725 RepID=A0AA94H7C9_9ENTR|nr:MULTISPECIES: co-chaperone DjlA [Kosakonia]SEK56364.1 DnaJ like chaperone protein [Kosakonia sacchari]ANI84543.1 co-chaperone DjlA [Kosakonia oryzae]APG16496.1 molecular chaperone DjlA [Kosakonia radicincitans]ARD62526.1 molecular chaperone DjlA [Kosakonia radicincitans DSM 16656]KDE36884.1 Dna-J like membrane chaperone protein [Kosakonia radicincitans UMEnt01/12]